MRCVVALAEQAAAALSAREVGDRLPAAQAGLPVAYPGLGGRLPGERRKRAVHILHHAIPKRDVICGRSRWPARCPVRPDEGCGALCRLCAGSASFELVPASGPWWSASGYETLISDGKGPPIWSLTHRPGTGRAAPRPQRAVLASVAGCAVPPPPCRSGLEVRFRCPAPPGPGHPLAQGLPLVMTLRCSALPAGRAEPWRSPFLTLHRTRIGQPHCKTRPVILNGSCDGCKAGADEKKRGQ